MRHLFGILVLCVSFTAVAKEPDSWLIPHQKAVALSRCQIVKDSTKKRLEEMTPQEMKDSLKFMIAARQQLSIISSDKSNANHPSRSFIKAWGVDELSVLVVTYLHDAEDWLNRELDSRDGIFGGFGSHNQGFWVNKQLNSKSVNDPLRNDYFYYADLWQNMRDAHKHSLYQKMNCDLLVQ
jgi:hypothetical protein